MRVALRRNEHTVNATDHCVLRPIHVATAACRASRFPARHVSTSAAAISTHLPRSTACTCTIYCCYPAGRHLSTDRTATPASKTTLLIPASYRVAAKPHPRATFAPIPATFAAPVIGTTTQSTSTPSSAAGTVPASMIDRLHRGAKSGAVRSAERAAEAAATADDRWSATSPISSVRNVAAHQLHGVRT